MYNVIPNKRKKQNIEKQFKILKTLNFIWFQTF